MLKYSELTPEQLAVLDHPGLSNRQVRDILGCGLASVSVWRQERNHPGCKNSTPAKSYAPSVEPQLVGIEVLSGFRVRPSIDDMVKVLAGKASQIHLAPAPTQDEVKPEVVADNGEDRFKGDTWDANRLVSKRVKTLDELIEVCGADLSEWEVERWECKTWTGFIKNVSKQVELTPQMFSVSATFKRRTKLITAKSEIADLIADAKRHSPVYSRKSPIMSGENVLECTIFDSHFGKLCWSEETGTSYDLKIAESLFEAAVETFIDATKTLDIGGIWFPLGNDLVHFDTRAGMTAHGTPQDTDSRQQKVIRTVRKAAVRAIDRFREIAPVLVPIVPGNHDTETMFSIGDSLECWYHNCPDVTIDNVAMMRKYVEHGLCMVQYTHGNEESKSVKLSELAANERPEMWARTRYREAHIGHTHQTALEERLGFRVRTISSISGTDAWHFNKAFVGNARAAEAFVWNSQSGLIAHHFYNVPLSEPVLV